MILDSLRDFGFRSIHLGSTLVISMRFIYHQLHNAHTIHSVLLRGHTQTQHSHFFQNFDPLRNPGWRIFSKKKTRGFMGDLGTFVSLWTLWKPPQKHFSCKNPPLFVTSGAKRAGQLVQPMRTSIPMLKSEIGVFSGNNLYKVCLIYYAILKSPTP